MAQLHGWLAKALHGERQLIFVTGEPGIGKTTLIEAFLTGLRGQGSQEENQKAKGKGQKTKIENLAPSTQHPAPDVWLGRGQCIEQYGPGEPYMPILEALGQLGHEPDGERLIAMLRQHAPTWLVQLPALLSAAEREVLQKQTQGVTRERMLREMGDTIDALTTERPLVLCLEDLHWSDASTVELLALLARRREPARLLVIGTYRPVDVIVQEHPLRAVKQELQLHELGAELPLGLLSETQVGAYLTARFGPWLPHSDPLPQGERGPRAVGSWHNLTQLIYRRTDGNPLFMVTAVEDLIAQKVLVQQAGQWVVPDELATIETRVPGNLQQLITQQIERLSTEERRMLEVASVAGMDFSAAAVATGLERDTEAVEESCEGLTRQGQFLRAQGTADWPDGTVAARYSFLHALYQEVLYNRIPARRRQRLHQRIGERQEAAYGKRAREIAAALAVHFEQGRDYGKAIQYLRRAGENALRRSAHQEAIRLLTKGLALLQTLPGTSEHARSELMLQLALGTAMQATKGHGAPEVGEIYARARVLCLQVGETSRLFSVLFNQWQNYNVQGEFTTAADLGWQLLQLAEQADDAELFLEAHHALWTTSFCLGEFVPARDHHKRGWAIYDPQQHHTHAFVYGGHDPGVCSRSQEALVLWALGYPAQALQQTQAALALAHELAHPMSLGIALSWAAIVYQFRREARRVRKHAEAAMALCSAQGFSFYLAWGTIMQGWALAEQGHHEEGIAQMRQGLAAQLATGAKLLRPYYLGLLAEAQARVGQIQQGFSLVAEGLAMVNRTGERAWEAELYRLRGELMLQQENQKLKGKSQKTKTTDPRLLTPDPHAEAEACFLKAIEIARKQSAKSWELRATVSLVRLRQQQGKMKQAHSMLAEIYDWFTEGFDTKDLQEARALLAELSQNSG